MHNIFHLTKINHYNLFHNKTPQIIVSPLVTIILRGFIIFLKLSRMVADNSSCTAYSKTGGLSTSFRNWNMVCHNYHPCWCTTYRHTPDAAGTDGIQNYLAPSRQPGSHAVLQRYCYRLPDLPLHCSNTSARCALQTECRLKH